MKYTFILFFAVVSFHLNGQDYNIIFKKEVNWENWEVKLEDSTKTRILNSLDHWLISEHYGKYDWISLDEELDKFKFIDLDLNGDLEIVYEGYSGSEPIGTTILKPNSSGIYSQIFSRLGRIISLSRNTIEGKLNIELMQSPCCAGIVYSKETWSYNRNRFDLREKLNWISSTIFPAALKNPKKFRVLNNPYTLRSSPEINDDNVLNSFQTGDLGYALAERKDNTGRIWWFVIMLNNQEINKAFYDYSYDDHYFSIGWMSSRYVELLGQ